ncbi:PREDICTED: muscle, skeletal receptor tyrosine protein kinase-like [Amphimedon queenslandica]|uniref:Protein kinase domain-containing protein n=1 Tax=Amphimedon queenslandica TaxID=400682 RepID=A0AAN0IFW3_AMPQE|nr:PREDICTED: muscle, skeletal receptor tyrosine protein kinase-like [Amphimedon queenslandica]|eukprot:XP_003388087.1 PREDICTED: muscle, skeletal receptor tyrosine protein kinase-like [Amphimedon queenslandica]
METTFSGSGDFGSGPDCPPPSICSSSSTPTISQPPTIEDSNPTVLIIALTASLVLLVVLLVSSLLCIFFLYRCSKVAPSSSEKEHELKRRSSRLGSNKSGTSQAQQPQPEQPLSSLNATLLLPKQASRTKIISFSTKGKNNQHLSVEKLSSMTPNERLKVLEFPHSKVCMLAELGESSFGKTYRGECAKLLTTDITTPVLIKTLREGAEAYLCESFEKEMKLTSGWNHPNILTLLAVSTIEFPRYMIYEWLEFGNLKDFLLSTASVWLSMDIESVYNASQADLDSTIGSGGSTQHSMGTEEMIAIVVQVAEGMEYLEEQGFLHKDLTARNCQIGEGLIVKISNFGFSHDIQCMQYCEWTTSNGQKSFGPLRWTAPETLKDSTYSVQSDVWAYGIFLWEAFSFGQDPYPELATDEEVKEYILSLNVMLQPDNCPKSVYKIMRSCWNPIPSKRPSFSWLKQALKASVKQFDLENVSRRFSYYNSPSTTRKISEL